jgi:hypothetical protein
MQVSLVPAALAKFNSDSLTHHNHNHHNVAIKELKHSLTRSGLLHPEVSSMVFLGSFPFWGIVSNMCKL